MNYSKLTKKELITILELRDKPVNVGSTGDAFSFLRKYGKEQQEYFFVLMLDGALKIKNVKIVSIGLANRTLVHPREVFAPAIEARCVSIIIAHNHPSGLLKPSVEDFETTKRICNAGNILGIQVLDHIIFSADAYHSMKEEGEMF